jgi:hypothetical protein
VRPWLGEHAHDAARQPVKPTKRVLQQGQALVRTIEVLEIIEPAGAIERIEVRFLLQAYRRRLRAIVSVAPDWLAAEVLSASQWIERPEVWLSENPPSNRTTDECITLTRLQ